MNQENVGKFISECRKLKKLTQEQLAEKIGVSRKSISRWENGNSMPDYSILDIYVMNRIYQLTNYIMERK